MPAPAGTRPELIELMEALALLRAKGSTQRPMTSFMTFAMGSPEAPPVTQAAWPALAEALDPLFAGTKPLPGVRVQIGAPGRDDWVGFGKLSWNARGHTRWPLDPTSDHYFHRLTVSFPRDTTCLREQRSPDVEVRLTDLHSFVPEGDRSDIHTELLITLAVPRLTDHARAVEEALRDAAHVLGATATLVRGRRGPAPALEFVGPANAATPWHHLMPGYHHWDPSLPLPAFDDVVSTADGRSLIRRAKRELEYVRAAYGEGPSLVLALDRYAGRLGPSHPKALASLVEAHAMAQEILPSDHRTVHLITIHLAAALLEQDQRDRAMARIREVLLHALDGGLQEEANRVVNALGGMNVVLDDRVTQAEHTLTEAERTARGSLTHLRALYTLADALKGRDPQRIVTLLEQAYALEVALHPEGQGRWMLLASIGGARLDAGDVERGLEALRTVLAEGPAQTRAYARRRLREAGASPE